MHAFAKLTDQESTNVCAYKHTFKVDQQMNRRRIKLGKWSPVVPRTGIIVTEVVCQKSREVGEERCFNELMIEQVRPKERAGKANE